CRDDVPVDPAIDGHDAAQGSDCVGNPTPDLRPGRGDRHASTDVADDVDDARICDEIAVDIAKDRHRAARSVKVAVDHDAGRDLDGGPGHDLSGRGGMI